MRRSLTCARTLTGTGAWAREAFGPIPLSADAGALQAAGSAPVTVPRPEPAPARDYAWCGATRINVPQLLSGAEIDVMLQVRTVCRNGFLRHRLMRSADSEGCLLTSDIDWLLTVINAHRSEGTAWQHGQVDGLQKHV